MHNIKIHTIYIGLIVVFLFTGFFVGSNMQNSNPNNVLPENEVFVEKLKKSGEKCNDSSECEYLCLYSDQNDWQQKTTGKCSEDPKTLDCATRGREVQFGRGVLVSC